MSIKARRLGKNELWWLETGVGSHGASVKSAEEVNSSLVDKFKFREETPEGPGLRAPQLGALHAILARRSIESEEPITIVMPTGTGKTETMLAAFTHTPARTLVVVPSDALRTQIATKFTSLGVLPTVGVISGDFICPVVAILRSAPTTIADCDALIDESNVIVATAAALSACSVEVLDRISARCERLFVDEAHHVAARTWRAIAERFSGKSVVQFTATPFREDGQHLGGDIAYTYPLRLAQKNRYFATINYHAITDLGDVDTSIASAAIAQLRTDIGNGLDHVLMARVGTVPRAAEVLQIYERIASDLSPVRVDSKMTQKRQSEALGRIRNGTSRIVVCVDMLGEGFDLSSLKVAAIHDPHKSLAVTLQFVGRFARVGGQELGDASVFVPRPAGGMDDRLRRLYGEDADWNILIRDLTEAAVDKEQARDVFENNFGSLPMEVAMRSIQPKMSTVVYRSQALVWRPNSVYDLFGENRLLTKQIAINERDHVVWFVTEETIPVPWGAFSNFSELIHHLYVVHCDLETGLMYVNSSNNDAIHEEVAKAVGGDQVEIIRGDVVYRVLARIMRRVPTNVGLLDAVNRSRRFSMHVGADVLEGFGPGAAQKSKTNIFAHGYAGGSRISFGASRKGRIWSYKVANNLLDWIDWVTGVGSALTDESISIESVMEGFIIPIAATERPSLVPLGIEWPYHLIGNTSETRTVKADGDECPILDLDLAITNPSSDGQITFEVRSDTWIRNYEMSFESSGPTFTCQDSDAIVTTTSGQRPLAEFMNLNGMTVFFEQEAVLSPDGYILQPDRTRPRYPAEMLEVIDWEGINIRKESQGQDHDQDSVQYRVARQLGSEAEWDVVVDDDGKGEVADLVFLRRSDGVLHVTLAHCKFSASTSPGARLDDLYEVCGQAVKSHKARSEMELVIRKLMRRERNRQSKGRNGIIRGSMDDLVSILLECRMLDVQLTVAIAQPGLSRGLLTVPLSELIGCTQLYLSETYNSQFRVLCSP